MILQPQTQQNDLDKFLIWMCGKGIPWTMNKYYQEYYDTEKKLINRVWFWLVRWETETAKGPEGRAWYTYYTVVNGKYSSGAEPTLY